MNDQITSQPDHGGPLVEAEGPAASPRMQAFIDDLVLKLNDHLLGAFVKVPLYTVATLPTVPDVSVMGFIGVSDEVGGATTAFSDGTNWRRSWDLAIVS